MFTRGGFCLLVFGSDSGMKKCENSGTASTICVNYKDMIIRVIT